MFSKYHRNENISRRKFVACSSLLWYQKLLYKYHKNENISRRKFFCLFLFDFVSKNCCIGILGMKSVLEQNLLLVPFCYETEKCCSSIIEKKYFLDKIYYVLLFCFLSKKMWYMYHRNENISTTKFVAYSFLV